MGNFLHGNVSRSDPTYYYGIFEYTPTTKRTVYIYAVQHTCEVHLQGTQLPLWGTSTPKRYSTPLVQSTAPPSRYSISTIYIYMHLRGTFMFTFKVQLHLLSILKKYIYTCKVHLHIQGKFKHLMYSYTFLEFLTNMTSDSLKLQLQHQHQWCTGKT